MQNSFPSDDDDIFIKIPKIKQTTTSKFPPAPIRRSIRVRKRYCKILSEKPFKGTIAGKSSAVESEPFTDTNTNGNNGEANGDADENDFETSGTIHM